MKFTYHAPTTPPIRLARGASVRPSTHTEPAGASGAAGAAPGARRWRPRAPILFGTIERRRPPLGHPARRVARGTECTRAPAPGRRWCGRPSAPRPPALSALQRRRGHRWGGRAPPPPPFGAQSWAQRGALVVYGAAGGVRTASPAPLPAVSDADGRSDGIPDLLCRTPSEKQLRSILTLPPL